MWRRRYFIVIILIAVGLVLYSLAYQFLTPEEEGRLRVEIDGQVFYDDEFNETYDYSQLWGKSIRFSEKLNSSEFASGNVKETVDLMFADLEEVCQYLRDLRVPNVVVGLVELYGNGTYDEVWLKRLHKMGLNDSVCPWSEFGTRLGDYGNGVGCSIARVRPMGLEGGLLIEKLWAGQNIWTLEVGTWYTMDYPPFKAVFTRYP